MEHRACQAPFAAQRRAEGSSGGADGPAWGATHQHSALPASVPVRTVDNIGYDGRNCPFPSSAQMYTMVDAQNLEDLAAKLSRLLPPGLSGLRHELEDNFRAVLRANLEKWDLVSRERFDIQAELLARTQSRLSKLEQRLKALEARQQTPASG